MTTADVLAALLEVPKLRDELAALRRRVEDLELRLALPYGPLYVGPEAPPL